MLEYFSYKKFKKNKTEKELKQREKEKETENGKQKSQVVDNASEQNAQGQDGSSSKAQNEPQLSSSTEVAAPAPVLKPDDETFLESLLGKEGPTAPLPARVKTPDLSWDSDDSRLSAEKPRDADKKGKGKEKDKDDIKKKLNRLSLRFRKDKKPDHLAPPKPGDVSESEADRERRDMTRVLDDLNLSANNNRAFSLSEESTELVRKFTLVLKDLVNGVPTAYNDLTGLLEDRHGVLSKTFEKLPGSMKKLVTSLPSKLSAAESQGIKAEAAGGSKSAAKKLLTPHNLTELVTKPGAVVSMLRAIVNALKLRWPAFMGTNIIWSVALFLLLFVLWYCHKRGREVRLEREKTEEAIDGSERIEELPDDPALPAPPAASTNPIITETRSDELPPPPIGSHAPATTSRK